MQPTVREVIVQRAPPLDRYQSMEHARPLLLELTRQGAEVSARLGSHRVWMLNSTEAGGGVAEMLPRLCSALSELGVDTRWLVLEPGDPDFFPATKALHNLVHGERVSFEVSSARAVYERVSRAAAEHLRERVTHGDVLIVHDPQPLGTAAMLPAEHCPKLLWRCHIGLPYRNDATELAWSFLHPYLQHFQKLLFSSEAYIPDEYMERSAVVYPSIDPISHKNRELRPYKLIGVLQACGLAEGPGLPRWARFYPTAQRFTDGAWESSPIPGLLFRPLILQVSRFDRLKGFQHLIPAFERLLDVYPKRVPHMRADTERVESELARVQLMLAGPDPSGVADDPEAADVLEELCAQHGALPRELAQRIHLVRLPTTDVKQNALMTNALQRLAAVVVQNSLKEGFGLTVSEALWKGTPVVAANVGGLGAQVRPGLDGLLVDDPRDPEAVADKLLQILAYPKEAEAMAMTGRARVREQFVTLSSLGSWLRHIGEAVEAAHVPAAEEPRA